MIICLCKNISDRQIREMADQGASTREVIHKSKAGTCCGACTVEVQDLVRRCRRQGGNPVDDQES